MNEGHEKDIETLRKIYYDQEISLDKEKDSLRRLDRLDLAKVKVWPGSEEIRQQLIRSDRDMVKRIKDLSRMEKKDFNDLYEVELTQEGLAHYTDERRHRDSRYLQNALIVITVIYAISATLQTITVAAANYGRQVLGTTASEWHSVVILSSIIALFGIFFISMFRSWKRIYAYIKQKLSGLKREFFKIGKIAN